MSTYKSKNHGLNIIMGLMHIDIGDETYDFPAAVLFDRYRLERMSSATLAIKTPAQQLCWSYERIPMPGYQRGADWVRHCTVSSLAKNWLDKNAPGWMTLQPDAEINRTREEIYFTRKSHALNFCRYVDEILAGINPVVRTKEKKKA